MMCFRARGHVRSVLSYLDFEQRESSDLITWLSQLFKSDEYEPIYALREP